jgi:RNA polymerase sigma-70 factor, ECF subfamily
MMMTKVPGEEPMTQRDSYYVERCLAGHKDDFRHLVRRYQGAVVGYLAGRLGNRATAEDAAQEAFVRAFGGLTRLKSPDSFYPWLIAISSLVAKEMSRDEQRQRAAVANRAAEYALERQEPETFAVEQAIGKLPENQRDMILLRYYGGLSCEEISGRLDIPLGTVTKTLSRGYAELRTILQNDVSREREVQR